MFIEGSFLTNYLLVGVIVLFIASILAGYIDAIAGGAGLILVPICILLGFPPQVALGQEKLVSTIGTVSAIRNFLINKSIIWKIVPTGLLTSIVGAYLGSKLIIYLPQDTIYYIIITMLPIGLGFTLYKSVIMQKNSHILSIETNRLKIILTCLIVGFYDGFFGPGTGSIFIICLYIINKMPLLNASATSKIFNFASNLGAFVGFIMAGKMMFLIGIPMIIGSLIGNHFGAVNVIKTNGAIIKKILIITVLLMLISMVIHLLHK